MVDSISQTWNHIRERVQARWPMLTDDDLHHFGGGVSDLASMLADRHGISTEQASHDLDAFATEIGKSLESVVASLSADAKSVWRASQEKVSDVVERGTQQIKEAWEGGRNQLDKLCARASEAVRDRPLTAIGIAVGVGAAVALILRGRKS